MKNFKENVEGATGFLFNIYSKMQEEKYERKTVK